MPGIKLAYHIRDYCRTKKEVIFIYEVTNAQTYPRDTWKLIAFNDHGIP
jgi:hypothetical protein